MMPNSKPKGKDKSKSETKSKSKVKSNPTRQELQKQKGEDLYKKTTGTRSRPAGPKNKQDFSPKAPPKKKKSMKDFKIGSQERLAEYKRRNWALDSTVPGGPGAKGSKGKDKPKPTPKQKNNAEVQDNLSASTKNDQGKDGSTNITRADLAKDKPAPKKSEPTAEDLMADPRDAANQSKEKVTQRGAKQAKPKKKLSFKERVKARRAERSKSRAAKAREKGEAALRSGDKKAALKYRKKYDKYNKKSGNTGSSSKPKAKTKTTTSSGTNVNTKKNTNRFSGADSGGYKSFMDRGNKAKD